MALITTLEGYENPVTVEDLFDVNDYMGLKFFGAKAWPKVKQAAAIIAQRAANAPILFYLRSLENNSQLPGQYSDLGRQIWGYNDRAGVELLGATTWGAVKSEFDELLGWNPLTTVKNVVTAPVKVGKWIADKIVSTNIPVIKETGKVLQFTTSGAITFNPMGVGEQIINAAAGKGYVTQDEIDAAYKAQKAEEREKMLKDTAARAAQKAAKAEAARGEYEKAQAEYQAKTAALEEAAAAAGLTTAIEKTGADNTKIIIIGAFGLAGLYLLTRKRK